MTQHRNMQDFSRRDFLGTAAGLTLALTLSPDPLAFTGEAEAQTLFAPGAWLNIATDGTITIASPAAEMGQGSFTTLPLIIAEELDADWAKVKPVLPPAWDEKKYGNPDNNAFQTSASNSVHGYFHALRIAGAQARRVLLDAVAARWNVPVGELSTEPSLVVHKPSNRRISYGEVAAFAKAPAEMPKIEDKDLKASANFRLIGKDVPRVEVPTKVTGAAKYAMDVQVPGMVYAAVLQSPYFGGAPQTVDDAEARKVPGIIDVVKLPDGVGVVGTTVEGTQAAKNLLKVTWANAPGANHDSENALEELAAAGRDMSRDGVPYETKGDAKAAMKGAARVFRGDYRTRYVYHAQMEPLNATASVSADGKSAEIWAGTRPAPVDRIVMKGSPIPQYPIANKLAEHVVMPNRARLAPWRGVGNGHNAFAAECFIDEMTKELGKDPIAFRLELSEGAPRMQTLLR